MHYHYVWEQFHAKEINLVDVPTHQNVADIFTNALSREKFEYFHKELGILQNTWIVTTFNFTPFTSWGFVTLNVYPMKA